MINNPCSSRPGTAVARVRQVVDAHEAHCVVILRGLGAPPFTPAAWTCRAALWCCSHCCSWLPRATYILDSLQLAECPSLVFYCIPCASQPAHTAAARACDRSRTRRWCCHGVVILRVRSGPAPLAWGLSAPAAPRCGAAAGCRASSTRLVRMPRTRMYNTSLVRLEQ